MATRGELYSRLGMTKPIAMPIIDAVYKLEEKQIWEQDLQSSPHGIHWHLSFHASSFPGDDPKACGRKAIYSLMNIPGKEPINSAGRAIMEVGKAVEDQIVWRLHRSGLLLSDPPNATHQMGFSDDDHWLTGSPDAIIKNPRKDSPYVIEIKSKDHDVVEQMQMGQKSYDFTHRLQTLTYIGLTHERSESLWPELNKCSEGSILYVSRGRPFTKHEFRFNYDKKFMEKGRKKLSSWKQDFINGKLPERPKSWKWTEPPCKYCPVKPVCKLDYKEKVTELKKSYSIAHAKQIRKGYDYHETRNAVLECWGEN